MNAGNAPIQGVRIVQKPVTEQSANTSCESLPIVGSVPINISLPGEQFPFCHTAILMHQFLIGLFCIQNKMIAVSGDLQPSLGNPWAQNYQHMLVLVVPWWLEEDIRSPCLGLATNHVTATMRLQYQRMSLNQKFKEHSVSSLTLYCQNQTRTARSLTRSLNTNTTSIGPVFHFNERQRGFRLLHKKANYWIRSKVIVGRKVRREGDKCVLFSPSPQTLLEKEKKENKTLDWGFYNVFRHVLVNMEVQM